jgi:hypothetical protein
MTTVTFFTDDQALVFDHGFYVRQQFFIGGDFQFRLARCNHEIEKTAVFYTGKGGQRSFFGDGFTAVDGFRC